MTVRAFAKINLTLEVLGERPDGFHALRSVVVPVSLYDTLDVSAADRLTSDTGYPDDLCLKAARRLDPTRGAAIRVTKRIPAGGGLGGGSADAAATLVALNELWGLGRTRAELVALAADVGSDVPALTYGGAVVMEGRGERVTPIAEIRCRPYLTLVDPGVASSTRAVYAAMASCAAAERPSATAAMVAALAAGDFAAVSRALSNDLLPAAVRLYPQIGAVRAALAEAGAAAVGMSGSGASVFALSECAEEAERLAAAMRARDWRVWNVRFVTDPSDDLCYNRGHGS